MPDVSSSASVLRILAPLLVSGMGALFVVTIMRSRRKRAAAAASRKLWGGVNLKN